MEQDINTIDPGSTCSIPQSLRKHRKIIIKNINPNITTEDLTNMIEENNQEKVHVKRFHSSYNHQPLPIACLTCEDTLCDKLLSEGINILGTQDHFVKYIKPVVCCFKCQQFGHISKHCANKNNCYNCGKSHPTHPICTNNHFCVNCKTTGHTSTSRDCSKYIERKSFLQNEVPTAQHLLF